VYTPKDRQVCWRCAQELPTPEEPKKKQDSAAAMRRLWIIVGVGLVIWILVTWLLPQLLGGGGAP